MTTDLYLTNFISFFTDESNVKIKNKNDYNTADELSSQTRIKRKLVRSLPLKARKKHISCIEVQNEIDYDPDKETQDTMNTYGILIDDSDDEECQVENASDLIPLDQ